MILITPDQLKKISTGGISTARATQICGIYNEICPQYGINSVDIFEEFIAQLMHESGEFTIKVENMNYTHDTVIRDTWPTRFNLDGSGGKLKASDYVRNPPKLANTVYANRMGNGDFNSGDGWRYRGGGPLQMTGEEAYMAFLKFINAKLNTDMTLKDLTNLVQTDDKMGCHAACWEFAIDKKLIDEAIANDYKGITKSINGGLIGWNDRVFYYERAKSVLRA